MLHLLLFLPIIMGLLLHNFFLHIDGSIRTPTFLGWRHHWSGYFFISCNLIIVHKIVWRLSVYFNLPYNVICKFVRFKCTNKSRGIFQLMTTNNDNSFESGEARNQLNEKLRASKLQLSVCSKKKIFLKNSYNNRFCA